MKSYRTTPNFAHRETEAQRGLWLVQSKRKLTVVGGSINDFPHSYSSLHKIFYSEFKIDHHLQQVPGEIPLHHATRWAGALSPPRVERHSGGGRGFCQSGSQLGASRSDVSLPAGLLPSPPQASGPPPWPVPCPQSAWKPGSCSQDPRPVGRLAGAQHGRPWPLTLYLASRCHPLRIPGQWESLRVEEEHFDGA